MILAILLASVIATTLKDRRAKSPDIHSGALSFPFARRRPMWHHERAASEVFGLPIFEIPPGVRSFPPLEWGFGVRPSQAAK